MTALNLYFKNAVPPGASLHRSLQDGGSAPASATTATGWVVGTQATTRTSLMTGGSERPTSSFAASPVQPNAAPSDAAGDCFRSENLLVGTFAAGTWTFSFGARSVTRAAAGTMRLRVRVWRSNNVGGSGAVELTATTLLSTTVGPLSTSADATPTVSWTPGAITLSNEYLFVQVAMEIVSASAQNTEDFDFRVGSAYSITTPNFVGSSTGTLSVTQAANTLAATATARVSAALAKTQAGNTLVASGNVRGQAGSEYLTQHLSGANRVFEFQRTNLVAAQASDRLSLGTGTVLVAGTLSKTQANQTLVGQGIVAQPAGPTTPNRVYATQRQVTGERIYQLQRNSGAISQAGDTLIATGTVRVAASASIPGVVQNVVLDGDVNVEGVLAATQANHTLVGTGTVAVGPISGTLNATQANQSLSAQVQVKVAAVLAKAQGADSLVAAATVRDSAVLSVTQAPNTLAGSAAVLVVGTLTRTQAGDTLAGSGTALTPPGRIATLIETQADHTLAAAAVVRIAAVLSVTQAPNTLVATAVGPAGTNASLNATQANQALAAQGTVAVTGVMTGTQSQSLSATGEVDVTGSLDVTQADDTLVADDAALPDTGEVMVNMRLVTGLKVPVAPLTGLKYAFFEQSQPQMLQAPVQIGDDAVIDSDGVCAILITNTSLQAGEIGFIVLSTTDGDPDNPWRGHCGPIRVEAAA